MIKMSREEFLKTTTLAAAAVFLPSGLFLEHDSDMETRDEVMIERLVRANDKSVEGILQNEQSIRRRQNYRNLSTAFASLTAALCNEKSTFYASGDVLKKMNKIIGELIELQYPNGTLDSGGNRQSPPDTAFLLESLCLAALILKESKNEEYATVNTKLRKFLLDAGEGIRTGGVHTPNHRWEISSILAKLYKLFGDEKYIKRIDQWLAEGIYQNEDGNYPERSRNYAVVENKGFISIGEILNRPEFFEIINKNLVSTYYYMELNGDLVCLDSRRQDQFRPIHVFKTYLTYRHMAIRLKSNFLAAVARKIEALDGFDLTVVSRSLPSFMANSILQNEMPKGENLAETYTRYFKDSDLVRLRRKNMTASIFAGNDLPLTIASGRSCNPTFFTFRKGKAFLEYARLSSSFFNTGYVRGEGLRKVGNKYILEEKKEAYYYDPMPPDKRDKNGDYLLSESLDKRFWSKMDFGSRPKTTLTLHSKITIQEEDSVFKIDIEIGGAENVEVTLDLCFREGGLMEGVIQDGSATDFFLEEGFARYTYGDDTIEVGPGCFGHGKVNRLDGEVYSTHFGTIKGKGMHLYLTGFVPFKHTFKIS